MLKKQKEIRELVKRNPFEIFDINLILAMALQWLKIFFPRY